MLYTARLWTPCLERRFTPRLDNMSFERAVISYPLTRVERLRLAYNVSMTTTAVP